MSLLNISQQITIYGGLFLVVTGVIGNCMNVLVFLSVRTYRTTPCTFYFLINSIDCIAFLTINLISRIVSVGFGYDLTRTSVHWCKGRQYLVGSISLISFTLSCLASIDQFLATSRNAYIRNLSNINWAHRIAFISVIICCLHGVPVLIYFNISPISQTCINTNADYAIYILVYVLSFTCFIPVLILIIFGYLTYRNIHLTRVLAEQQADRQLTRMTLIQVVLVVISITPYGIINVYSLLTAGISKDTDRLIKETFASTVITLIVYVYYVGNFYMFLISSSRFRRAVRDRILFCRKRNLINPTLQPTLNRQTIDRKTAI